MFASNTAKHGGQSFRLNLVPTVQGSARITPPHSSMPATVVSEDPVSPPPESPSSGTTRIVRRAHLYLGLFLAPWLLMYALSTLVMAHRPFVLSFYRTEAPATVVERELDYSRTFPPEATAQQKAGQILQNLGLEGRHSVAKPKEGAPLVINRQHALFQRRITFDPAKGKVTVQREEFRGLTFLERMHRRRGFQDPYAVEDTWALSVDVAMVTLVFWGGSGLWLWWGIRPTRLPGAVCLGVGVALFAAFLALI